MPTAQAQAVISNRLGMHARPAMAFVESASKFKADIKVHKGSQAVDGKSIMQLMMLAATAGTELTVAANGPDAEQAVQELTAFIASGFGE